MGVYFRGPQILIRSGAVAMAEACCCQDEPCDCCEHGTGGATMRIRLAGFPNTLALAYCNLNLQSLNTEWELPFEDLSGGYCRYHLRVANFFTCGPTCPGDTYLDLTLQMACQPSLITWQAEIEMVLPFCGSLGGGWLIGRLSWNDNVSTPIDCTYDQFSAGPFTQSEVSGNLANTSLTVNP